MQRSRRIVIRTVIILTLLAFSAPSATLAGTSGPGDPDTGAAAAATLAATATLHVLAGSTGGGDVDAG